MKSEQMKTLLFGILLGLIIAFGIQCSASSPTDAATLGTGRYQVSTCAGSNHIYVTVLDTETGDLVRQERHYYSVYREIDE